MIEAAVQRGVDVMAKQPGTRVVEARVDEARVENDERSLLEAILHRVELIRQHSEQQVAALRSLYIEIGGLRTDIANLMKVLLSKEK